MPASHGASGLRRPRPIRGHILLDDETQRKLRRRRLRRLGLGLALGAAVIGAVLLYRSPLLRVQDVQVTGTTNLDPAQLRELAGLEGATMFDPPLDRAEERIAALPLVNVGVFASYSTGQYRDGKITIPGTMWASGAIGSGEVATHGLFTIGLRGTFEL